MIDPANTQAPTGIPLPQRLPPPLQEPFRQEALGKVLESPEYKSLQHMMQTAGRLQYEGKAYTQANLMLFAMKLVEDVKVTDQPHAAAYVADVARSIIQGIVATNHAPPDVEIRGQTMP